MGSLSTMEWHSMPVSWYHHKVSGPQSSFLAALVAHLQLLLGYSFKSLLQAPPRKLRPPNEARC